MVTHVLSPIWNPGIPELAEVEPEPVGDDGDPFCDLGVAMGVVGL